MKVQVITTSDVKVEFEDVVKNECDGHNLYIYHGIFFILQTIIPLEDIKEYSVEGR